MANSAAAEHPNAVPVGTSEFGSCLARCHRRGDAGSIAAPGRLRWSGGRLGERRLLALKSPAVAPAEGLLIEAVLKHARIVLNRRP
jgi:hypothetical protein